MERNRARILDFSHYHESRQDVGRGREEVNQSSEPMSDVQIDALLSRSDNMSLSEWEANFVTSVKQYWQKYRKLSDKQRKRLGEIRRKQNAPRRA